MNISKRIIYASRVLLVDEKDNESINKEMVNRGIDAATKLGKKEFKDKDFYIGVRYQYNFPVDGETEVSIYCHEEKPREGNYQETYFNQGENNE